MFANEPTQGLDQSNFSWVVPERFYHIANSVQGIIIAGATKIRHATGNGEGTWIIFGYSQHIACNPWRAGKAAIEIKVIYFI